MMKKGKKCARGHFSRVRDKKKNIRDSQKMGEQPLISEMELLKFTEENDEELCARMQVKLKKCFVVLHQLTDEEINRPYPSFDDGNEITDDIKSKTEELLCKTVEAVYAAEADNATYRKNGSKRRMRESSKMKSDLFERYKEKRLNFLNRKNKAYHSENSLDWSQDESRTFSDGAKRKKKTKRGRKYEKDFEWNPFVSNESVRTNRKLRNRVRKVINESESSSSEEEEDMLFDFYMDNDSDSIPPELAFQNSVPSDIDHNSFSSTVNEESCQNNVLKDVSDKRKSQHHKTNFNLIPVDSDSSLQNLNSMTGDILSGIIEDMNQLQGDRSKTSFENTLQTQNSKNIQAKNLQKGNKKLKAKSRVKRKDDIDREVYSLLRRIVSTVSTIVGISNKAVKKFERICIWCSTPFSTNENAETWCAICHDRGMYKSVTGMKKIPVPPKIKSTKDNKLKKEKISKTMSEVLKRLPKNEMQRLMYTEKADKMSGEKGYNHCKSYSTPKGSNNFNNSLQCFDSHSNSTSLKVNESIKKSNQVKRKNNISTADQSKRIKFSTNVKFNENVKITAVDNGNNQSKSLISLEKFNDGLFLMSFPDPNQELDSLNKSSRSQGVCAEASVGKSNIVNISRNSVITTSKTKELSENNQHDAYLFPPIPTVIVSNYSSDTNSLNLSHTYYQNEITHQRALKSSSTLSKKLQSEQKTDLNYATPNSNHLTSIPNNILSNQNLSFSTSNLLPNNTPVTITALPNNQSFKNVQSLAIKTVPVFNSEIAIAPNKVTILPVISSVMSIQNNSNSLLDTSNENVPSNSNLFSVNNFNNLPITITKVCSQAANSILRNSDNISGTTVNERSVLKQTVSDKLCELVMKKSRFDKNYSKVSELSESEDVVIQANASESITEALTTVKPNSVPGDNHEKLSPFNSKSSIPGNKESQGAISSVIEVLEAVSILAVIDLEKNPHHGLNARIQVAKVKMAKINK